MKGNAGRDFLYQSRISEPKNPLEVDKWLNQFRTILGRVDEYTRLSDSGQNDSKRFELIERYLSKVKNLFHSRFIPTIESFPTEEFIAFKNAINAKLEFHPIKEVKISDIESVIKSQRESLDVWINYFVSPDSRSIPLWAKFWAFQGVVKMSGTRMINKSTGRIYFPKREKNTFANFPELNKEALAQSIEYIVSKVEKGENIEDRLNKTNFHDVYSFFMDKLRDENKGELENTEGFWVKYTSSDPTAVSRMVESIKEKGTGWCIVTEAGASEELRMGDIHIYYTTSTKSDRPNPRIAIRFFKRIVEVRGIAHPEKIDSFILSTDIIEKKFLELDPDNEHFRERILSQRRLTHIIDKTSKNEELNRDELIFLYELETKYTDFDGRADYRLGGLKDRRNLKKDFSVITGFEESQIATSLNDIPREGVKCYVDVQGQITLTPENIERFLVTDVIYGRVCIEGDPLSLEKLIMPKVIHGNLTFFKVFTINGLRIPKLILGNLFLRHIKSIRDLTLDIEVHGKVYLSISTSDEDFEYIQEKYPYLSFSRI